MRPSETARCLMFLAMPVIAAPLLLGSGSAFAGNEANFILYSHHTEEKGETEIKLYYDVSTAANEDPSYNAQLFEIEHGVTDFWTTALYVSGQKTAGEDYDVEGWRFENRVRLFDYGAFLNPVLYVEYERLKSNHKYIRAIVGRTDEAEEEEEGEGEEDRIESEFETKLILGHDFSDRFNVAFNWINEVETREKVWEFGYAFGFNYALFKTMEHGADEHSEKSRRLDWSLREVKIGAELFGGLGDSERGLTLDAGKTAQYAGLNLQTELANGFSFTVGGAVGLTDDAEDALLRLSAGYEFD